MQKHWRRPLPPYDLTMTTSVLCIFNLMMRIFQHRVSCRISFLRKWHRKTSRHSEFRIDVANQIYAINVTSLLSNALRYHTTRGFLLISSFTVRIFRSLWMMPNEWLFQYPIRMVTSLLLVSHIRCFRKTIRWNVFSMPY